jgi:hypothetical protein
MRDRDTEIRHPHDSTVTREGGRKQVRIDDPRVSVSMQEEGATLTLFFEPDTAWTGEAPLLEVRLSPTTGGTFEPWRLLPTIPHYLQYARASLARDRGDVVAALNALQRVNAPRRGLDADFLRDVGAYYKRIVDEGERYPIKALAAMQHVDKSTASRWVAAARARGFLPASESEEREQS